MGGIAVGAEGSATAWESVFNLGNCAIGAGILSFPYAFWLSGALGGVCLCLVVASIEYFTLNIIARQSTIHGSITYQGLVKSGLGQVASEFMSWTILAFIFGSCVAYIIIVGDNFGAVIRDYIVDPWNLPAWMAYRQVVILVLSTTIVLPISLQRSMVALAPVSTVALAVMTITTVIVVAKAVLKMMTEGATESLKNIAWFNFDLAAVGAIPVMVFAYHCHVQSVPIYYELTFDPVLFGCAKTRHAATQRSADAPATESATEPLLSQRNGAVAAPRPAVDVRRKLFGMARVLAAAYAECTVLYLSTGIAGYLLFPERTESNILNNFAPKDHLMQVMRVLVGFAVLLHYPINQHVARSALYDLICHYSGVPTQSHVPYKHVAGLTLVFFVACVGTACLVSDLGIVFQVIGGLAGSLLVFVLPGGLVVAHCWGRAPQSASVAEGSGPSAPTSGAPTSEQRPEAHPEIRDTAMEYEPLGWALIVLGAFVFLLTMYITFFDPVKHKHTGHCSS